MLGQKFGMLTVVSEHPTRTKSRAIQYECLCDCGKTTIAPGTRLRFGNTRSCGCGVGKKQRELKLTHGYSRTKTYKVWSQMKQRCDNPNTTFYEYYGGRGISYDSSWEIFENFLADMGEQPKGLELDRVDSDENYCKVNCRWVDHQVNSTNKKSLVKYDYQGKQLTLKEISGSLGISYSSLRSRIFTYGDSLEQAIDHFAKRTLRVPKDQVFTFTNGEDTVTMNRIDFANYVGCVKGNVTRLILGKANTCTGYRVLT